MTFSPWMVYVLTAVALTLGGYVKGCSDEHTRFEEYKITVKAVGQAQEANTRARIARDKLLQKETDENYRKALSNLRGRHTRELERLRDEQRASGSVVPAPGSAPGRGDKVCYDRRKLAERLDSALAGLLATTTPSLQRGDELGTALKACVDWAKNNANDSGK